MNYVVFLYDDVQKISDPIQMVEGEERFEQIKRFYRNDCRFIPEWKSYIIYEFDKNGFPTNEVWVFNQHSL